LARSRSRLAFLLVLLTSTFCLLGAYLAFAGAETVVIPDWSVPYESDVIYGPDGHIADSTKPVTLMSGAYQEWYNADVTVSLEGTRGAEAPPIAGTRYSRAGGAWTAYGAPIVFTAEGVTRLDFMSVDVEGVREDTRTAYIGIDRTPPGIASDVVGSYTDEAAISFEASDTLSGVSGIEYCIDGGEWLSWDGVDPVRVGLGDHTIEYAASDHAGNAATPKSASFSVTGDDVTPPVTMALLTGGYAGWEGWYNTDVSMSLEATDALRGDSPIQTVFYSFTPDWPLGTPYTDPVVIKDQGVTDVWVWAVDEAGNVEAPQLIGIPIDKDGPTLSDDSVASYTEGVAAINITADDPAPGVGVAVSGVYETQYRLNGATEWTSGNYVVSTLEGDNTLEYEAVDNAGNVSSGSCAFTITRPESNPPESSISGIPTGWATSDVEYTITAIDETPDGITSFSDVDYGGGYWAMFEVPQPTGIISGEGHRAIYYFSVDKYGNRETYPEATDDFGNFYDTNIAYVDLDKSKPAVWSDVAGKEFADPVAPKLDAWDAVSGVKEISYRLDAAVTTTTVSAATATLPLVSAVGEHTIRYVAVDVAGNESVLKTSTFEILGDVTPPVTAHNAAGPYTGSATITLTPADEAGGSGLGETHWTLSGAETRSGTGTTVSATTAGGYSLQFHSHDLAGNVEGNKTVTFTVIAPASGPLGTAATIKTNATSTRIGGIAILSGSVAPTGLIGKNMVVYVKKPGSRRWTYSSNRTVYSLGGGAAWQYKYVFKRGMKKGVYYFKAVVPTMTGFTGSESGTISVRLK
jgi:hypothetical protein